MDKKIAIINHWMVNNYGALFLAYALERRIRELGYNIETVSWLPDEVRYPWKFSMVKKAGIVHYFLRLGYFAVFILPRQSSFKHFRDRMNTSKEVYTDSTLKNIAEKYDKIIVGGDQLWNCKVNYYNENNFLPFVKDKAKKVVYAASLSQDFIRDDFKAKFKELAEGFSYITTREERAREIIEGVTGLKAPRVADPAFLLDAAQWEELAEPVPISQNYVFVYQVQSDKIVIDFANKLAKQKACKIVYCPFPLKKQIRCIRRPYISPEQWLGYMRNAKYVVTDAFHGVVFFIIFRKDFYAEISEYGKDTGSRITNILNVHGLQDRLVSADEFEEKLKLSSIDYTEVNKIIAREKQNAEYHIKEMLSNMTKNCNNGGGTGLSLS